MAIIRKSIVINAPVETVYDFLTRPQNLLQIWPSLIEVRNVKRAANGAHSFDWTYKMAGVKFRGHTEVTEVEPNKGHVARVVKGIPSTFIWTYIGLGNETTVNLEVEYTMPGRVLRTLSEPFVTKVNERDADALLTNLKTRLELDAAQARPQEEARVYH